MIRNYLKRDILEKNSISNHSKKEVSEKKDVSKQNLILNHSKKEVLEKKSISKQILQARNLTIKVNIPTQNQKSNFKSSQERSTRKKKH
ncbi:12708_t:CDS:2 [Racocetra fulgida]|uniref:12708_t:CDS:1 n=1 Tax=Racocetra fulgida TaxID=60492 RepID=A0A9N8WKZ3_9GLOM|nr:12708_t:CDS:2 [Racocetra fulgida]